VLDWHAFAPGGSILDQIQEASARCSAGIFLFTRDDFTRDDKLDSAVEIATPRDNVVFEAGFFVHAKGKERVLIVREKGSKMPADLGGDIYASLEDRSSIEPVRPVIERFVAERL
jgi:predicted nucleotide-binding protein